MSRPPRGFAILLALLLLAGLAAATVAARFTAALAIGERDRATERALAQAREALVAYAAQRPLDDGVGPGRLPCPDADDDGWAEATCGSLAGDRGQDERLGRLPWKTLGLGDLRDGSGERLWYAVSTRYKGLLNCAASAACVDLTPDTAIGTITVTDTTGRRLHDGTRADPYDPQRAGAVAVVIAPGPALVRSDGHAQHRECAPPDCAPAAGCLASPPGRAARCDPRNYLDRTGDGREDNASFHDRSDAAGRAGNGDGFVLGPEGDGRGGTWVNDRVVAIGYDDVMPRVMARVGAEVARCLRLYAATTGHGGRVPWAAPACGGEHDAPGATFGRIPAQPFDATRSSDRSLDAAWPAACPLERPEGAWWARWRPFVFYAVGEAARPDAMPGTPCEAGRCPEVREAHGARLQGPRRFVVAVAGPPLAYGPVIQRHDLPGASHWLEAPHAPADDCATAAPAAFVRAPRGVAFNDVVVAGP